MKRKKAFWVMFPVIVVLIGVLMVGCPADPEPEPVVPPGGGGETVFVPVDLTQWDTELREYIAGMTDEEKIGQTIQASLNSGIRFNDVETYMLGSTFPNAGNGPNGYSATGATPAEWVDFVNSYQAAAAATRLQIPIMYAIDAVHGHNCLTTATIFPHNAGLGAIAVGDLAQGIEAAYTQGRITAEEMRATGMNWTFSPQATVAHDVRWGRAFESYGENSEMVAAMTKANIQGLQSHGIAACAKHYIGEGWNLFGINGGGGGNAGSQAEPLTPEMLADQIPPFRAAIEAGVYTIMPALSNTNGIHMHRNTALLTDLLRDELGFQGFVVGDWNGSGVGATLVQSFNSGVDMHMMGDNDAGRFGPNTTTLRDAVRNGQITQERLDEAVLRILRVKKALGLLDADYNPVQVAGEIGTEENRAEARKIAAKALTLMKNDNQTIQKLKTADRILITGHAATSIGTQCGGWTYNWRGRIDIPTAGTTIEAGIRKVIGSRLTLSHNTAAEVPNTGSGAAGIAAITGEYDAIIAVIGDSPHAENVGDRAGESTANNATIPIRVGGGNLDTNAGNRAGNWNDEGMLKAVYDYKAAHPNVLLTVIMLTGRPMTITSNASAANGGNPHHTYWDAFVVGWLPGSETGDAVADVLFGDKDFVGATPYTWRTSYATITGYLNAGTYPPSSEVIYEYGYGLKKDGSLINP